MVLNYIVFSIQIFAVKAHLPVTLTKSDLHVKND